MGRLARSAFETFWCSSVYLYVCVCSFNQETQPFTKLYQLKKYFAAGHLSVVFMHTFFKTRFRCERRFLQDIIVIQVGIETALGFLHMFQNCVLQMKTCRRNQVEFHL